jgi:hypothetical protein
MINDRKAYALQTAAGFSLYGSDIIAAAGSSPAGGQWYAITVQKAGTIASLTASLETGKAALLALEHAEGKVILGLGVITAVTAGTAVLQLHRDAPAA